MDEFLIRAVLAGAGIAVVAGPLGSFVVWRRLAYFGDTLAHAALLGITLGLLLGIDLNIAVIGVCLALALAVLAFQQQRRLAGDTLLGILSHTALSAGLVALSLIASVQVDLFAYLFGDVLTVTVRDLAWIYGGGVAALAALVIMWRPLLALTVHEELAQVEGVPVFATRLGFIVLIALVIAVSMKIVGVLLITSLLILPAASARRLARSPEHMAIGAALVGVVAVVAGIAASIAWDAPAGPAIVLVAAALFLAAQAMPRALLR